MAVVCRYDNDGLLLPEAPYSYLDPGVVARLITLVSRNRGLKVGSQRRSNRLIAN